LLQRERSLTRGRGAKVTAKTGSRYAHIPFGNPYLRKSGFIEKNVNKKGVIELIPICRWHRDETSTRNIAIPRVSQHSVLGCKPGRRQRNRPCFGNLNELKTAIPMEGKAVSLRRLPVRSNWFFRIRCISSMPEKHKGSTGSTADALEPEHHVHPRFDAWTAR
jgi:hypothetical protein